MMPKKYYDGFIIFDTLSEHLKGKKLFELIQAFADAKGVDAEPVKHGHWVDTTDYIGFPVWQCSQCNGDGRGDYFRCPWCGAKMDERKEDA